MNAQFKELDWQQTPMGELTLRRRRSPSLDGELVYEVKLNGQFLMSSAVTQSEVALADLAIRAFGDDRPCDVLVGGLGLGYTADAALRHANVRQVRVVEYIGTVIEWHHRRLVPAAERIMGDPRCEVVHEDFFQHVGEMPAQYQQQYDIVMLDIDHSPEALLHPAHARFYSKDGLEHLCMHLNLGGIFALWSAGPPDGAFMDRLQHVFREVEVHPIRYYHPMLNRHEENIILIARTPESSGR